MALVDLGHRGLPLAHLLGLLGEALEFRRLQRGKWGEHLVDPRHDLRRNRGCPGTRAVEATGEIEPEPPTFDDVGVGRQQACPIQIAAGTHRGGVGHLAAHALRPQLRRDHRLAQRRELELHTTRGDGHEVGSHLIGQHDEQRAGRRFLDGLQQDRSGRAHQMEVRQDQHLQ